MKNIEIKKRGKNKYLEFDVLNKYNLIHGFTIKSKNFKKTEKDYKRVCEDLKLNKEYLKIDKQIHSNIVRCVFSNKFITDADGLITNKKNLALFIRTADCISMILYDPKKEVIGNVHSGWKGTHGRIIENAIKIMQTKYSSKSEDIIVCVFPSILMCHFEVEYDVYSLYEEEFKTLKNINKYMKKGEIKEGKQKYFIDTVMINKEMMLEKGIKEENIYLSNMCTYCNNNLFNSYRRKDKKGRNLTVIAMKGE